MAGWFVRPSYQIKYSKFSVGPLLGFGCLSKGPTTEDLLPADMSEIEDLSPNIAEDFYDRQGEITQERLSYLKYYELGISSAYRISRGIEIVNVTGYRNYFDVIIDKTGFDNSLPGGTNLLSSLPLILDNTSNYFTDFGLNIRLHSRWSISALYHYEFSPVIEREDKVINGHSVGVSINYQIK